MNVLFYAIIIILAAIFAFRIHYILGIIFIALTVFYLYRSNYHSIMSGRGNAEYNKGNKELALEYYEKAIKKGAPTRNTFINYSMMLLRCGEPKKALEEINKVLSALKLPIDVKQRAKQVRSIINFKLGNIDEAYDEALEIYEDGYTISLMRGLLGLLMLNAEKDSDKVLEFCENAYDYDSDNRDIADNYILALINSNKFEEAKAIAEILLEKEPYFLEAYYHGALVYKALGENNKAKELLEKTVDCKTSYMTTVSEKEIEELKASL